MDVIPAEHGPVATAGRNARTARWTRDASPRDGPQVAIVQSIDNNRYREHTSHISVDGPPGSCRMKVPDRPGRTAIFGTDAGRSQAQTLARGPPQNHQQLVSQKLATMAVDPTLDVMQSTGTHPASNGGWS
jgi:hypothetical protein